MAADPRYQPPPRGNGQTGHRSWEDLAVAEDHEGWVSRSRVFLTPIAAPSIMGLFGFMIATLMLGSYQAGWYGSSITPLIIWPFALFAGGIMQSVAAIASLRARDGVAVAVHSAWGSFWVGWGILQLLVATHIMAPIPIGASSPSFAFWFIALTLVTAFGVLGSIVHNLGVFVTLAILTAGSAVTAAGFWSGSVPVVNAGGWLFVFSAAAAWLTAGVMVLEHSFGRTIMPPAMRLKQPTAQAHAVDPIGYTAGMPGVRVGQ